MFRRTMWSLSMVFLAASASAGQTTPDTSLYAVAYVDVVPASTGAGGGGAQAVPRREPQG